LRKLGCDCMQGYYFSRPKSCTDVEELLDALPDHLFA
jgi:EAL domain-containing protein (putative c-di-GMP-specific phosphodiesterase class I)